MSKAKGSSSSSWHQFSVLVLVLLSILFNIVTYSYADSGGAHRTKKLSWSQRAVAEAEAVAAISCSGHGRAYLDGLRVNGKPVCECNQCFQGPQCSEFIHDCAANADSGDPLFMEEFWVKHAASSAVVVSGWHRMSYVFPDSSFISQELEKLIRRVHKIVGNAKTDGKYIIFGAGSTQLLNAATFALSMNNNNTNSSSSPAKVVVSVPFYPLYESQTDFFANGKFEFGGEASSYNNSNEAIIEFVTSPNNPDGVFKKPVLQGRPSVSAITDHAYYWPHYSAIPAPSDEDLMIFTMSKVTGHAGSRFGWAIIKDESVYERMSAYMDYAAMGISRETQLRAFQLFRTIVEEGDGRAIFNFAYHKMRARWENLTEIVSKSDRFTLQHIPDQYCNFFHQVRGPSPAYGWVKCEKEEDKDCYKVFQEAKITGRDGKRYGADNRYVRLSLIRGDDDFHLLLARLSDLVAAK